MTQGKRQVNVWLDDETYHRLKGLADANERTVGAEARMAVRAWMAAEPCPIPGCQFEASHLNEHPCGTRVPTVEVSAEDRAAKVAACQNRRDDRLSAVESFEFGTMASAGGYGSHLPGQPDEE